jgi:surfactin synthase thioesterase subunit
MGAIVAFETLRRLNAEGRGPCRRLLVSGRRAPSVADPDPPLAALADDAFLAELQRRYGGIPQEVLEHRDLLQLLLPGLRADIEALEGHVHRPGPPLACPISAYGGAQDPRAARRDLEPWAEETTGATTVEVFPGGHFYLQAGRRALVEAIASTLADGRPLETAALAP